MQKQIEWAVRVGGGAQFFPNLAHEPEGSALARLRDGSRVILRLDEAGEPVITRYLHGPSYRSEMARLGITDKKHLRVRREPDRAWEVGPIPPELEPYAGKPIPEALRGRLGTVVGMRLYKYVATLTLELHRQKGDTTPGQPRRPRSKIEVPFIWLETPEEATHDET